MQSLMKPKGIIRPLLLAAGLGCASPLLAAPTAEDRETARGLMDQADDKYEARAFEEALRLYLAAHQIMNVPTTGIEVAKAQAALGQLVEARNTALAVVRMPREAGEHAVFEEARTEARRMAEALSARIPSVQMKLSGVSPGTVVRVAVDGTPIPEAATLLPRKVNPGEHRIVVTAAGYQVVRRTVTTPEGKAIVEAVELKPVGESPPAPAPAAAGAATSRHAAEPAPATLMPPTAVDSTQDTGAEGPRPPLFTYVGFGVGGAGLAVGSIAGLMVLSKASDLESMCEGSRCPPAAQDDISSGQSLAIASNVGFALGLAGVAVGVYGLVSAGGASKSVSGSTASTAGVRSANRARVITPIVGPGAIGLAGRF